MAKQGRLRIIFKQQVIRKADKKMMVDARITTVLTRNGRPVSPEIFEDKFKAAGIILEES